MAKKTRREKEISDERRLYKFSQVTSLSPVTLQNTKTHALPGNELTKTFVLTLLILAMQILLFLSLKNHLINIPGITY